MVKLIMAGFLTVLWTVVGVHCQLEVLPGMEVLRCDTHQPTNPASSSHCGNDNCTAIERGHYQCSQHVLLKHPPLVVAIFSILSIYTEAIAESFEAHCLISEATAPPIPWQFFARAALSPRAPSFIS